MGRYSERHTGSSYVHETSQTPCAAAEAAAERKRNKYSSLSQSCLFVPIAVETMGAISKDGMDFLCELGRRITQCTDDHCESAFLFWRLSVLIQRYNAVAVLGIFTHTTSEDEM